MAQKEYSNQLSIFNVIIFICLAITYVLKLKSLLFFNVSIYIIMNIFVKNHKRLLYLTGFFTAWVFISPALFLKPDDLFPSIPDPPEHTPNIPASLRPKVKTD